ncbi:MAG: cellulase N-terminal Ig-like domain-containing protein [Bacteroidales bacterium]|nr:cellulase N-terminal Ig-like domain-containing protein [Bacteroidales bacterium]
MKPSLYLPALIVILFSACNSSVPPAETDKHLCIRMNQVGYYPGALKEFLVADYEASSFQILDRRGKKAFEGKLIDKGAWDKSGEHILQGDFSDLSETGTFTIQLNTGLTSPPFEIAEGVYEAALDASIKSFYFQRASMAIEEPYGGVYRRAAGHSRGALKYTGKRQWHPRSAG